MKVSVIIPAAGKSTRFGDGHKHKLEQDLGGRALLLRAVEPLANREEVTSIIVGVDPERVDEIRMRFGDALAIRGAKIVPGGKTERWETVKNCINAIDDEPTHVAVHDGARPCLRDELIEQLFEAAQVFDAVIPAIQADATLKRVSEQTQSAVEHDPIADAILGDVGTERRIAWQVEETLDRDRVMAVQTPQVFTYELLRRAYAQDDLCGTDDATLIERLGESVHVITGDPMNIKITTETDMKLARSILGVKPEQERPTHLRF